MTFCMTCQKYDFVICMTGMTMYKTCNISYVDSRGWSEYLTWVILPHVDVLKCFAWASWLMWQSKISAKYSLDGHLVGHLNCHLVSNLIGWKSGSLFHVHMFLLFTSKVPHFWNFQPILSNIFFVDQPTSPMPFHAADQPVCSLCLISRRDSMMGRRIVKNNLNNCFIMVSLTYN